MSKLRLVNKKERGISLPISLFVLIGIMLSSMLLMRSGDMSVTVAGNLGNRIQAGGSNDVAMATAFKWLQDNKDNLKNDDFANGYYSSHPTNLIDYTKDDSWIGAKALAKDELGNTSAYKIIRMCTLPNAERNETVNNINNICQTAPNGGDITTTTSSVGYGAFAFTSNTAGVGIAYKILVRTLGPKNSEVVTETVVSL